MSHSFSRSWKSPAVVARERWSRILKARDHICPDSPFLTRVFDLVEHRRIMREAKIYLDRLKTAATKQDATNRAENTQQAGRDTQTLTPFHAKAFHDNLAPVIATPTVWCTEWRDGKPFVAPWPSVAEMKYEGDERISTSVDHRRFLPVPRYPCDDAEVQWSQVAFLPQYHMDECQRIPSIEEAFFMTHEVPETEITDDEGVALLGKGLMEDLDPHGIYCTKNTMLMGAR